VNSWIPCNKINNNQWVLSRFHALLVNKNWSLSDPDPKLIIPDQDPDPANNFISDRIRIHNTVWHCPVMLKISYWNLTFQARNKPVPTYLGDWKSLQHCPRFWSNLWLSKCTWKVLGLTVLKWLSFSQVRKLKEALHLESDQLLGKPNVLKALINLNVNF